MFESWSDTEVLEVVQDSHRQASMLMARQLAAVAQLLGRRIDEELDRDADVASMITGFARTSAEVSAAMNLSAAAARQLVRAAEALDARLPAVGALLARGELDWATVELIISRTDLVADTTIAQLDAWLAERVTGWRCWSRRRVQDAVDQGVLLLDRDAAKQRRTTAFDERAVHVSRDKDGMARVRAAVSALDGATVDRRLSQWATSVCPQDPRTLAQRRADALVAAVIGTTLSCGCGHPDCPARDTDDAAAAPSPVVLNVIAPAATLSGSSEQPGYLAGFGVIDAELVRELARDATARLLEHPEPTDAEALRYRPGAALARWIRCRDLTCRFPGCTVPAQRCDIDHTEPFNHTNPAQGGLTVPDNLACYCREHHRLKTFHSGPGGWHDQQLPGGVIVWTSPTGQTYRTHPGGADLFPELDTPRPLSRSRSGEQRRRAHARERLRQHRPASTYHCYRNRAATDEIRRRAWRNQTRRFRVLFHGQTTDTKPSTSPFCTWINDPIEPETLPPNWQPPPPTHTNPDEPPPF